MKAPLIGVTTRTRFIARQLGTDRSQEIAEEYVRAVHESGGLPVLIPSSLSPEAALDAARQMDGVLLSGGDDVDPLHFGEDPRPGMGPVEPARDLAEIALTRWAVEEDRPLFGICRGIQVMNAALGGSVVQHLPEAGTESPVLHEVRGYEDGPGHDVLVEAGTLLFGIVGKACLRVSSAHHQAPGRPAEGLVVSARARDGVVEGLEHPGRRFVIGVQWHPERTLAMHPESVLLFRAFVEACSR